MEHLHHHTLSNMLSNTILEAHCAWILSCFDLKVGNWLMGRPISPTFWLSPPILSTTLHLDYHIFQLQASFHVFSHLINLMDIHLYFAPMAMSTWEPWCNFRHFCYHCVRCLLSCGTKTITCAFFNHVQFLLSTSWHCAHYRWHSHLSWCCHCWPYACEFTSPILHNSKICCLNAIQVKERTYHNWHPIVQFLP